MASAHLPSRRLLLLAWTLIALGLAACGGGSDGGPPGGGGGSGGTLTVEQRNLATGRVAAHLEAIAGPDTATPQDWEALRAWVLTQPEFVDAGVGDQTLWARFTDGRYFLYTDNWKPVPGQQAQGLQQARREPAAALRQAAVGVPASPDALLVRLLAQEFSPAAGAMTHMASALQERGWTVGADQVLTLAALKNASELGFLFLTGHSGIFGPTGDKDFAVITEDDVSDSRDASYAEDLDSHALIYHRDRTLWQRYGLGDDPNYAITSKFVTKYMKFSPESLVILASCHSGSPEAGPFRDALRAKGAGTIVGWDGNANANAFAPMDLMIDRLAGMNAVNPVTPPNRAFRMDEVWAYLDAHGLLQTQLGGAKPATPIVRFGSGFTMLNPILAQLQATGIDKLVLYGQFGHDPATVTVGGQEFGATTSPDGTMIDVDIGPDVAGDVVVTTRKRKSNPRMLASWRGQVKYVQKLDDLGCGPVFSNTAIVHLHLRADAHGVRDEVDGPVRDNRMVNVPASDTTATWSSTGTCVVDGEVQGTWSGGGRLPFLLYDLRSPPASLATADVLLARIDAVEKRMQLAMAVGPTMRTIVMTPDSTDTQPAVFNPDSMGFVNDGSDQFRDLMPWGTFLPFDSGLAVPAGHQQKESPDFPGQTLAIDWALSVAPSYDDSIGR